MISYYLISIPLYPNILPPIVLYTNNKFLSMDLYPNLITEALALVKHPGKGKDIVSLDMIEDDIKIDGKRVSFSLLFDRVNDPFVGSIKRLAYRQLSRMQVMMLTFLKAQFM